MRCLIYAHAWLDPFLNCIALYTPASSSFEGWFKCPAMTFEHRLSNPPPNSVPKFSPSTVPNPVQTMQHRNEEQNRILEQLEINYTIFLIAQQEKNWYHAQWLQSLCVLHRMCQSICNHGWQHLSQIEGTGTAVCSFNGKVVKTKNCLHILALRGPLYSLRTHRIHHGCWVL